MSLQNKKNKVVRQKCLAEQIVIVDGQPGCGKTMLSPIIASLDRVELVSYAFEIEFICRLHSLEKIDDDAAIAMVRMLTDHKLYQTMMGRDVNFRFSDLSSAFRASNPWRYFKRIFQEGDMATPDRIANENPILNLTTHDLLGVSDPVISGLGARVVLIEVVRHPLYMIKQQYLNMARLIDNPRDIQICIEYDGKQLPYFANGWEDRFLESNDMDRAVYSLQAMGKTSEAKRKVWNENSEMSMLTIPFEKFVFDPFPYMSKIVKALGTREVWRTHKVMKEQNVPRKKMADAPALPIYKRCGWMPPSSLSEQEELNARRDFVAEKGSAEALTVMDKLSEEYVTNHLSS